MRLLRINDIDVEIDDQTAIGIDFQTYDLKEPAKAKVNISNTFSVPKTINNLTIFGLASNVQSLSTLIYDQALCNYWIDNEKLIDNAKIRVEQINERIELFIYEKQDFWEDMKEDLWPDFVDDLLIWLNTEKGLPIVSDPDTGSGSNFLDSYFTATDGVVLPLFLSNLADYITLGQKKISSQTVIGSALSGGVFTIIISSGRVVSTPLNVAFPVTLGASGTTIAAAAAVALNASAEVSAFYEASSSGATFYLTSKEGLADPTLNIAYTSTITGIVNVPISTNIQSGADKGTDFLENTYDTALHAFTAQIYLKNITADEESIGGHFCVYEKTLFEFIESRYGIDMLTSGGVLSGNVWDDTVIATKLFIPIRDLDVVMANGNSYFQINRTTPFLPLKDQKDKADKSVYDYVLSFIQHLNIIIDEVYVSGEKVIRLARFDDLETVADVVDFSGKLSGEPIFKPRVEGYGQNNRIKFKGIYPEGNELINSTNITCENLNLDAENNLFDIDSYIPSLVEENTEFYSYLADKESFKTFVHYISDSLTADVVSVVYQDLTVPTAFVENKNMKIAEVYSLDSEYNFLDEIIDYPRWYEIQKWLTITDIKGLEFFKQYFIRELNGSFFINKISGFNPDKSKEPTTIELIRLGDRTPIADPDLDYWTDGVADAFTDGFGDYFF